MEWNTYSLLGMTRLFSLTSCDAFVRYRRDARYLPHVTRVANPFETANANPPQEDNRVIPSHITLPSEKWRALLEIRFKNFRKASSAGCTNSVY
jgi:hypothetical protein